MEYYFKRDVWKDLLEWKKTSRYTLEVKGARQVGKTFILKKFCEENFKQVFYINLLEQTGADFLRSKEIWSRKYFGKHSDAEDMLRLMRIYAPQFEDSEDTVVLIDEIQESSEVYNLIRQFTRNLETRFIVTGSYLGKAVNKNYFQPVGDLEILTIYSLSFPEFLDIFGMRDRQLECCRNLESDKDLEKLFGIYITIGGYPAVIIEYLDTKNIDKCLLRLDNIVNVFTLESEERIEVKEDAALFKELLTGIAAIGMKEKQGISFIEELMPLVSEKSSLKVTKKILLRATAWLYKSGIINFATKLIDADTSNPFTQSRLYFNDTGLAGYFMRTLNADYGNVRGYLTENYVYGVIRNRFYARYGVLPSIAGIEPQYTTYSVTGGELDFILCGLNNGRKIGIEVKSGKNVANTGRVMLENGKIDQLYVLNGNTYGGMEKMITVPLYLTDQIQFDLSNGASRMSFF